jgi:putative transposase
MVAEHNDPSLSAEAFEPQRTRVDIRTGSFVRYGNLIYRITQVLDFDSVVAANVESGRSAVLRVGEIRPIEHAVHLEGALDIDEIANEDWKMAEQRFAAISPLLEALSPGRQEVEARAKEVGVNAATLYRWLSRYRAIDAVSALISRKRGWKSGRGRIPALAEGVIQEVIENFYLTPQRPTAQKAVIEVLRLCAQRHIDSPSASAIRARLTRISERDRLRRRGYKERAKNKFQPVPGAFPGADYPLSVVQIDHTPVDIILVDDEYRKPIDRPWLTLAIDVCTRMVVGYYLSFDAPSETSVAMCVAQAILPKEEWLLLHKVEADWPVWGRPHKIHVDNGPDFRSSSFRQSCMMHGIHLEFRPVKQPRYGGHIERLLGTLLREIHDLPGTTFSSIKQREGYDPERHAAMTKSEFEEWFVTLICMVYHQRLHSAIGMSPLKRWEIGIFGNAQIQGVGIPPRPTDRLSVLLDFLPLYRRTIQPIGVTIEGHTYYAEALRPWIGANDPDNTDNKRQFIFRRDPRDISILWFFDPELRQYFKVPFADQSMPAMSVWENRQAKELLRRQGAKSINEHQILKAVTELRQKVNDSKERSKRARRQAARRADHARGVTPVHPVKTPPATPVEQMLPSTVMTSLLDAPIEADNDIA